MAAILNFSILTMFPYFDSVDPVLIRFSMLQTPHMQIFMLSSGSAHLFDISTQLPCLLMRKMRTGKGMFSVTLLEIISQTTCSLPTAEVTCLTSDHIHEVPCLASDHMHEVSCLASDLIHAVPCLTSDHIHEVPCLATDNIHEVPCLASDHIHGVPCLASHP